MKIMTVMCIFIFLAKKMLNIDVVGGEVYVGSKIQIHIQMPIKIKIKFKYKYKYNK